MIDKDKLQKAKSEITVWEWAARILPFVALAVITSAWYFGVETWIDYLIMSIISLVTAISVFWWWWAISKIAFLASMFHATADRLEKISQELKDFKNDLKG